MPSHILPEVYTWELRLSLIQGFHQYEVTLESRIGVPPVNFSKIFHPGNSYSSPPPPSPAIRFWKSQGQNVLLHQCFSYQRKKEFFDQLIHPIIYFLSKDDSNVFVYVLKTHFLLLSFFNVFIKSIDFRMHFKKKGRRVKLFFM